MLKIKLAIALSLAAAAGVSQAASRTIPANIQFDGSCDGLSDLVVRAVKVGKTKIGKVVSGTWSNVDCNGAAYPIGGKTTPKGYFMTSERWKLDGFTILVEINTDGTYTYIGAEGEVQGTGTWSEAVAPAARTR